MSMQPIAFFSLARQVKQLAPQIQAALDSVVQSQQFIGGPFVERFEKELAQYLQANHVISCNSGTDALWLALKALGLKKDSLVLTTAFSFIASSSEIAMHEAHPVFIDVDEKTLNISTHKLEEWLQAHAVMQHGKVVHKASGRLIEGIVAVDLFGQCADYNALQRIADAWGLWIVEDAAQAIGASYKGKKAGTLGKIGCFSFYPTKNLGAYGDAGACVTDDPYLAERLLQLRNHGRKTHYDYEELGKNSRLDGMQAALLSAKLPLLDGWNARRAQIAQRYNAGLQGIEMFALPAQVVGTHVFHQYSLVVNGENCHQLRDSLGAFLNERGIQTRVFYPKALCDIPFLNTDATLKNDNQRAQRLPLTILALPMWPEITDAEIDVVIATIKEWVEQQGIMLQGPAKATAMYL